MLRWLIALLVAATPAAARAEWREAVTTHFIVYGEADDAELRQSAIELEKYDYLLRLILDPPKDHPVRLKVYLMKDMEAVQKTMGLGTGTGVAGYYNASPRGSLAVAMRAKAGPSLDFNGKMVLFHEYAHHLMLQYFAGAYPIWYTEGFAEYYGTTKVLPNGFEIGQMASYRRASFHDDGDWLPLKELLTARNYKDIRYRVDLLYAEGWLLVHYLTNNQERRGQLGKYLALINRGADYKTAMDSAFGPDAADLNAELRRYSKRGQSLEAIRATFPAIDVGPVEVRTLSPARSALMKQEIALGRGIFAREAAEFAAEVRRIAGAWRGDPDALSILAEAERLAGNADAAAAAADGWLAARPGDARAMMMKGLIQIDRLVAAKSTDSAAWAAARKWVADAKRAAPEDPLVLEAYYDSFAADGSLPPAKAQNALYHAMELVPQDNRLRYRVAADFERRNLIEAAIVAIRPAAFGAHDSGDESEKDKAKREKLEEKWRMAGQARTERPRDMLARLEAKFAAASGTATPAAPAAAQAPASR